MPSRDEIEAENDETQTTEKAPQSQKRRMPRLRNSLDRPPQTAEVEQPEAYGCEKYEKKGQNLSHPFFPLCSG
jgi:hypothetical protein